MTKIKRKRLVNTPIWLSITLAMAAALIAPTAAHAAIEPPSATNFPNQPITILVPRGRGGGSHQLSSRVAVALEKTLGTTILLENKPGEHGKEAIYHYDTQPPNGYTILQHVDDIASLYAKKDIRINPSQDDLIPLAIGQVTFSQLYIRETEDRFNDLTSFIDYAKAHPNTIKVAIVGHHGSMESVLLDAVERKTGVCFQYVPYNKPVDRYLSLVENNVDALVEQPGDVSPFLDLKLIRPVLTLLPSRPIEFPNTPSAGELDSEFPELYRFRAFFVHAATPDTVKQTLMSAFDNVLRSQDFEEFNTQKYMTVDAKYRTLHGARSLIQQTIANYQTMAKSGRTIHQCEQ